MSSISLELRELDMEYQALESEIFMHSFLDNTDVYPYDIATEVAHSTFQAQFQNRMKRIGAWFKRLFAAIPKLFAKIANFISHSQLVTKARLKKELPKDFKEMPKDKLQILKDLRLQILNAKNQLLDASNKRMESAVKLMEAASVEMNDIANIIRVGDTSKQEVIDGKVDVSKGKLEKIKEDYLRLKSSSTCVDLQKKIDELVNKLQNLLENATTFEVAVPSCKGENKATYYANKAKEDCGKWDEVADRIESMMNNAFSTRHDFHRELANDLSDKSQTKRLNFIQRSQLKISSNIADSEELSRAAGKGSSRIMELINLYRNISNEYLQISKEYGLSMARCYKVYGDSDAGSKHVQNIEVNGDQTKDENGKNKKQVKESQLKGQLKWNSEKGCWYYVRSSVNKAGNFIESRAALKDYTDKDTKPTLSKELIKQMESGMAKEKGFKRFANDGDIEYLQNYNGDNGFVNT